MKQNILVFLSACMVASLSLFAATPARGTGTMQIDGSGTFEQDCNGQTSFFTMALTGSLNGCWFTNEPETSLTPSGLYQEWGSETFDGCLQQDGNTLGCGTFATEYHFTGKFAPTGEEIHGRCQHRIVVGSGTGIFVGATGRLDFKDDVQNAIFNYRGHIALVLSLRGEEAGGSKPMEFQGEERTSC